MSDTNELNIIVMDNLENVIAWLDPDLCEITETSSKDKCRKIKLTYPIDIFEIGETERHWYDQGNKIYIPSTLGITSCLYVINTSYTIDYWDKNIISFEAEEVLTEMNYNYIALINNALNTNKFTLDAQVERNKEDKNPDFFTQVYLYEGKIQVTTDVLNELFGQYYTVTGVDQLDGTRNSITPYGTMSYMSLFRLIEEQTERKFITKYVSVDNKIVRTLELKNINNTRNVAQTEYLDLNYNMESLELEVTEENTYTAMAPVFQDNSSVINGQTVQDNNTYSSQLVTTAESDTQSSNISSTIQEWLYYEVAYQEKIPMIIQKNDAGELITTATWKAPFSKRKGCLYIEHVTDYNSNYNNVSSYQSKVMKSKIGKVETSETNKYIIYNTLANTLLQKLNPQYELKVSVKDIQILLGLNNLGYTLHETLYVKIPNFNYYVPCIITETVKNLHHPGENTIKVETNVTSLLHVDQVTITTNNILVGTNEKNKNIGGIVTSDDKALKNALISINLSLVKAYDEQTNEENFNVIQVVKPFEPAKQSYIFPQSELQRLTGLLRNEKIYNKIEEYYILRTVEGILVNVPHNWCLCISDANTQIFYNNAQSSNPTDNYDREDTGKAYFDETLEVREWTTSYDTIVTLIKNSTYEESKKYYVNFFMNYIDELRDNIGEKYPATRGLKPFNNVAEPPAGYKHGWINIILNYYYKPQTILETQQQINKLNIPDIVENMYTEFIRPVFSEIGFTTEKVELTYQNIISKIGNGQTDSIGIFTVNLAQLDFKYKRYTDNGRYNMVVYGWFYVDGIENIFLQARTKYDQTNNPNNNPDASTDVILPLSQVLNADHNSYFYVITPTEKLRSDAQKLDVAPTRTEEVNTEIQVYNYPVANIQTAINKVYDYHLRQDKQLDIEKITTEVVTSTNVTTNLNMKQLRALAYAHMLHYWSHDVETLKLTIPYGKDTDALKYYEKFGSDTDFFTPTNPRWRGMQLSYALSTALFELGYTYSYKSLLKGVENASFTDAITDILRLTDLKCFTRELNEANIKKFLTKQTQSKFKDTVILAYIKNESLLSSSIYNAGNYPIMMFSLDNNNIQYLNLVGKGNSTTERYDTTLTTIGTENPYKTDTISNIITQSEATKDSTLKDAGTMLIITRDKGLSD